MKLFKKFKNGQECKLCHTKVDSTSATKKHLEMSHAGELFKFRGKYLTSVKKVMKKLRNKNGRQILEKLRDCDLVMYPEAEFRLGKRNIRLNREFLSIFYDFISFINPNFLGYKCLDCHKSFITKPTWKLHQAKRNHDSKILFCRYCHWTFREKHQFDQHDREYPPRFCIPLSLKKNSENDEFSQCLKISRKTSHF